MQGRSEYIIFFNMSSFLKKLFQIFLNAINILSDIYLFIVSFRWVILVFSC